MSVIDHAVVAFFALIYPIYGLISYRRYLQRIAQGAWPDRMAEYTKTMVGHWLLAVMVLVVWLPAGRPLATLGFSAPAGWRFWVGAVLAGLSALALVAQLRLVARSSPAQREAIRAQFRALVPFLPHTRAEYSRFAALSVTAGVVEEMLWRGYLIWYLAPYAPLWVAVVASSLLFGWLHAYQGVGGALRTAAVGLVMAGLYVLTESLWVPMVLHVLVDLLQGRLAYVVVRTANAEPAAA